MHKQYFVILSKYLIILFVLMIIDGKDYGNNLIK